MTPTMCQLSIASNLATRPTASPLLEAPSPLIASTALILREVVWQGFVILIPLKINWMKKDNENLVSLCAPPFGWKVKVKWSSLIQSDARRGPGAQACDCKFHLLTLVEQSVELSSTTQHAMPPEFGGEQGFEVSQFWTECLKNRFPLPILENVNYWYLTITLLLIFSWVLIELTAIASTVYSCGIVLVVILNYFYLPIKMTHHIQHDLL